jgi:CHAD domain-containing protein
MATDRKIEVEAKYRVMSPGAADRYLVAPEIGPFTAEGTLRSFRIEDRYVDAGEWNLAKAGFAARLRKTSRGVEIGLKTRNGGGGAVHRREEIEGPADATAPPADWPASSARDVVMELCGDQPLLEIVTIRQLRRVRSFHTADATAELSVDEVEIVAGGEAVDRFEELELEIKDGDESSLPPVIAIFDADPELKAQSRSKFERAIKVVRTRLDKLPADEQARWALAPRDLSGGQKGRKAKPDRARAKAKAEAGAGAGAGATDSAERPGAPAAPGAPGPAADGVEMPAAAQPSKPRRPNKPDARSMGIQSADTLPEAARKILEFHFRRLKNREAGARSGEDPEELHDMRVAARRMRAAWRVFDGAFKPARTRKLRRRLSVLSDRLGGVRDLDVLIGQLEQHRAELDESVRPGLDPLISLWRKQRAQARTQLVGELDSKDYCGFLDDMDDFLDSGANAAAMLVAPTAPHRVRDSAPSEIWTSYEAVRVYELVLPWADVETLHDLRIATKWLRYSLEFFGELLGPDAERLMSRVAALQDHLGCLHDADVAAKLTRDLLVARAGELTKPETAAIGGYLQSREREMARRRRALGPVWRAVNGAPFRRALGRATASL